MTLDAIDPAKLYPLSEAARLLPAGQGGKRHLSVRSLQRWRLAGRLPCTTRTVGGVPRHYVRGEALLGLFESPAPTAPAGQVRSPAEARAAHRAAMRFLERRGIKSG